MRKNVRNSHSVRREIEKSISEESDMMADLIQEETRLAYEQYEADMAFYAEELRREQEWERRNERMRAQLLEFIELDMDLEMDSYQQEDPWF